MRTRRTSISLGGGLLLALTLALSGCGGGADQEAADTAGDTAQAETREAAAPAPADTCPSPASFTALTAGQPGQDWTVVTNYVAANPLDPTAAVSGKVKLCDKCDSIQATITPLQNSCGISPDSAGLTWLLGTVTAASKPTDPANMQMFGPQNDSSRVYLVQSGGQTYAVYPTTSGNSMKTAYVAATTSGRRWNLKQCKDSHGGKAAWDQYPTAQWDSCPGNAATADSGAMVEPGDDDTTLTYGWMTCIGGCCRFYGPQPPNPRPELPEPPRRPVTPGEQGKAP